MSYVNKQYNVNGESDQGYDICKSDCPVCGTPGDFKYGGMSLADGESVSYPWTCRSCESEGHEIYYLEFSGHNVTIEHSKENRDT
jgi:hypothetical protein